MVRIPDDSDDDQPPDPASPTAESDSDERPLAERRSRQNRSQGGVSEGDPARAVDPSIGPVRGRGERIAGDRAAKEAGQGDRRRRRGWREGRGR